MSAYPEHDKLAKVAEDSQKLGEFLDWLIEEGHVTPAAEFDPEVSSPDAIIESLLAAYFRIDLDKIVKEKLEMLNSIRALNDRS